MLPEAFLERMKIQLGDEYPSFLQSLERPRAVALRFNPLKGEMPTLPFVGDNVPWEPMGFYYDPEARPGLHPYHEAGVYYLQEASAMAPVQLLDPSPVSGSAICALPLAERLPKSPGAWRGRAFYYATRSTPSGRRSCPGIWNAWALPTRW